MCTSPVQIVESIFFEEAEKSFIIRFTFVLTCTDYIMRPDPMFVKLLKVKPRSVLMQCIPNQRCLYPRGTSAVARRYFERLKDRNLNNISAY